MICYKCNREGHYAYDCDAMEDPEPFHPEWPVWCGQCDERTRQLALAADQSVMARCPRCHPLRSRELPQHRSCPTCHARIYSWDNSVCGSHTQVGAVTVGGPAADSQPDYADIAQRYAGAVRADMGWPTDEEGGEPRGTAARQSREYRAARERAEIISKRVARPDEHR